MSADAVIHPSSVIEPGAVLGDGVRVGPFCIVGSDVVLGSGVELISHVSIAGATRIGNGCRIYPNAVLGMEPQNLAHKGGRTTLTVGKNNVIRESVTIHTGSDSSRGATTVGDDCYIMAYSHIAHDCSVGNKVTMANGATLAGHCEIGDNVTIGGMTAVLQFSRVGNNAFLAGMSGISGDVIPYGMAQGNLAKLRGLNVVGMRRAGMSRDEIKAVKDAYRAIFDRATPLAENIERARGEFAGSALAMSIIDFLSERGRRYFITPPVRGGSDVGDGDDASD